MLYSTWIFSCDSRPCGETASFTGGIEEARKAGWAVSRDRKHCYCPNCAPMYRNVGQCHVRWWKHK